MMRPERTQTTEKIDGQATETRDLKQEMAELKASTQATPIALQRLQAKDQLVAQQEGKPDRLSMTARVIAR